MTKRKDRKLAEAEVVLLSEQLRTVAHRIASEHFHTTRLPVWQGWMVTDENMAALRFVTGKLEALGAINGV